MGTVTLRTLRRHWLISLLLIVGAGLRVLTVLAYRPAIMFFGDSYTYVVAAQRLQPPNDRPFGYSFALRLTSYFGDLGLVTVLQHLAGLALAVVLYAVVVKRGAPTWLGALVATPILLDGYVLQIEHNILSETMFVSLLLGAVLVVTRERVTLSWAVAGGVLLAAAALTRTVAIPIAALFIGYLLVRRLGVKVVAGFALAMVIPLVAYMAWFQSVYGVASTSNSSGRFLYGRVAVFADCNKVTLSPSEHRLCDSATPASRPNANFYVWSAASPVRSPDLRGPNGDEVAASFSRKVILAQPLTYARYVATDMAHYFAPGHFITRVDSPLEAWRFPLALSTGAGSTGLAHSDLAGNPVDPRISAGLALFLRGYQSVVYTQGPILLLALLLGLAAPRWDRSRRRWDAPFIALVGLAVMAIPSLTVMFDYRYGLPAIPLLMLSGGIGLNSWLVRQRETVAVPAADATTPATGSSRHRRPARARPAWVLPGVAIASVAAVTFALLNAPVTRNAGFERYVGAGAELGSLGPAVTDAEPQPDLPGVTVQQFDTGVIVSTASSASVIPQRFMNAVERNGGLSAFGLPRTGETRTSYDNGLHVVEFANGWVYSSRLGGTHAVYGTIFDTWSPKPVRSRLREPLADAYVDDTGEAFQPFAGGSIIRFSDGSVRVIVNPAATTDSTDVPVGTSPDSSSSTSDSP